MKMRVIDWERVQFALQEDPDAAGLIDYIEQRTWGKEYQAQAAIGLDTESAGKVAAAVERLGIKATGQGAPKPKAAPR